MVLYDSRGEAIAYCENGKDIFLFDGRPVAYFTGEYVYTYDGHQLGTFVDGWLRDNDGYCVLFTERAQGGPVTPVTHIVPIKRVKHVVPIRHVRDVARISPTRKNGWSNLSAATFFGVGR